MLFHAHNRDLDFELAGRRYVVPHGSEVEIPDHLVYCVKARGLLLHEGPSGGERVRAVEPTPSRPVAAVKPVAPTVSEVAEELADVTGEDPVDESDVDVDTDNDAAMRTAEQLERSGITLPGRRPRRKG